MAALFKMFPDDDAAEAWFVSRRWPDGVRCPQCGCDNVQDGARHPSQRFRCRGCRSRFSTRTGTVLADSNIGFRDWAIAIKEIKRRSRVVGVFPNEASAIRLVGAILADLHDEWQASDRRYLSEHSMAKLQPPSDTTTAELTAHC